MGVIRAALLWASENAWLGRHLPRLWFVRGAVRRFLPGENLDDALAAAHELAGHRIGAMLTHLGEHVTDAAGAAAATDAYLAALDRLAGQVLDVEISLKLSQLGLEVDPEAAVANLDAIVRRAGELGIYVWVDMEASETVEATLEVYRRIRHRHANVGICVQACLFRTSDDVEGLLLLGAGLRLVKGAYREPADVAHQSRCAVDAAFAALAELMFRRATDPTVRIALATHDVELLDAVERAATPERGAYEVQMLYGIRVDDQHRMAAAGYQIRVLIGYGTAWYPWYVRRLAERPANLGFVARNVFRRPPPSRHPVPAAP